MNQAQLRLQKEHRYRELLEQAAEGVCLTDQGFGLLLVNQAFCDMFGYTQDELLGMNMAGLVLAQDQELLASQLADILQGKTVYSEQFLRHKNGSSIRVEGSGKLMRDGTIQIVVRDISERKKSEEKLRQTEAFYRAITEKSYEGITVIDKNGKVRYRSKVNAEATGHQDEELTEENFARFTHPDDQERIRDIIRQLAPNESRLVELRLKIAGGEWRWLENRITNLLDHPAVQGYVINTRDIHERKQAEAAMQRTEAFYRAITEQSNEGVMVFDQNMTIIYRNPSQLHMTFFPYEEMVGQNRTDLIHPDDLEAFRLELPHLRPGQTLLNTFRLKTQDGKWEWFESRVTNLLEHPAVRGYVSNYSNINERKEAEARQRELSQQLLKVQEEERRALARELHDEIGQSLTAIKVSLQTAQRFGKPEAISNALDVAEQLLSQVRELSLSLHPGLLEDLGLVAAVRWYALQHAERSRLKIELELELEESRLSADLKIALYRVVQEGLTNIVRHSKAQQVTVSLLAQNNAVVLRIKDDGVGFDVNQPTKASLGLLGMKERVTLQGGRFQIRSSLDSGTELYASFPLGA